MGLKFVTDTAGSEESEGIFQATGKFLEYGVAGSAVSAVASFVNTGIALGNALGGESEYVDTEEAIAKTLGQNAAEYYSANSAVVDTVGLIGGSLLPGLGAIKAARMLSKGYLSTSTSRLATGLKDTLHSEARVGSLINEIKATRAEDSVRAHLGTLVKANAMQGFVETTLYEAGTLLTMNQSSALNSDDLGYFEAIGDNLATSGISVVFGAGVSGALGTVVNVAALRKGLAKIDRDVAATAMPFRSGLDTDMGDEVVAQSYAVRNAKSRIAEINSMSTKDKEFYQLEITKLKEMVDASALDTIATVNKASVGYPFGNIIDDMYKGAGKDIHDAGNMLAGSYKLSPLQAKEGGTPIPGSLVPKHAGEVQQSLLQTKYLGVTIDQQQGLALLEHDINSNALGTFEANALALDAAGYLKVDTIKKFWNSKSGLPNLNPGSVRVNLKDPSGKPIPLENVEGLNLIHNNPPKARKGGQPPKHLSTMLDLRDNLQQFAYDHDPLHRQAVDNAAKILENPAVYSPEYVAKVAGDYIDMISPQALFSTAYRVFNSIDLDNVLTTQVIKDIDNLNGKYKPLYDYMANNKALASKYGTVTATMDRLTANAVMDTVTPHFGDLTGIEVKPGVVSARGASLQIRPGSKLADMTPTDASGFHTWAESKFGGKVALLDGQGRLRPEWAGQLSTDSLPELTVLSQHYDFKKGAIAISGHPSPVGSAAELSKLVRKAKHDLIVQKSKLGAASGLSRHDLALYADVSPEYVDAVTAGAIQTEGKILFPGAVQAIDGVGKLPQDFGSEFATREHYLRTDAKGTEKFLPRYFKVHYRPQVFSEMGKREGSLSDVSMRILAEQEIADRTASVVLGEYASMLPDTSTLRRIGRSMQSDITGVTETSGFLASNNPDALSAAGFNAYVGRLGHKIDQETLDKTHMAFHPIVSAGKKSESALMELSILQQSTLRTGEYIIAPNVDEFITRAVSAQDVQLFADMGVDVRGVIANAYQRGIKDAPQGKLMDESVFDHIAGKLSAVARLQRGGYVKGATEMNTQLKTLEDDLINIFTATDTPDGHKVVYDIQNKETREFLELYQKLNGTEVRKINQINQVRGERADLNPDRLYPGKVNTKTYKHIAFVSHADGETNLWATKSQGMLFAHTADDLARQIRHLENTIGVDKVKVVTQREKEAFERAQKAYDAELAVTETSVDSTLRSQGKLFNLAPQYNPRVMEDMIDILTSTQRNTRIHAFKLKYAQEVGQLESMHGIKSQYGALDEGKKGAHTAYSRQLNTLLGLKDTDTHSWWYSQQETADLLAGKAWNTLKGSIIQMQTSGNWKMAQDMLDKYGMPSLITKEDDWILSNIKAPNHVLSELVGKVNTIFAFGMLKLDAAASIVNIMSRPIMSTPAFQGLAADAMKVDETRAKILGLTNVIDPKTKVAYPTGAKMQQQAIINYWNKPERLQLLVDKGIVSDLTAETRNLIASIAYRGQSDYVDLVNKAASKLSVFADKSELFTKYISAEEAMQALDALGVPQTHPLYWSTVAGHVNQIHGNYTASQRPTLFQGWAGQAVGLFQTYQFNMIQQFMKHVGDKTGAASKMLAIQTAMFGAQSVPGFQFLNEHIAQRTVNERDIYSSVGETFDTPVAEFLLYGGGSSLTRPLTGGKGIDFFSRGNLTPRTPILIPTSLDEIPAYKAIESVFNLIAKPLQDVAQGVDVTPAVMDALAHNGLNRPIANAAQIWGVGAKTSKQGVTLLNYQDVDWITKAIKLSGTSTMNEAIATQSYYRSLGMRAWRMEQLQEVGTNFRKKLRNEGGVTQADLTGVMAQYAELGGKSRSFNRWMRNQYAQANDSAIGTLRDTLSSKEGNYLQRVLGNDVEGLDSGALGSVGGLAQ